MMELRNEKHSTQYISQDMMEYLANATIEAAARMRNHKHQSLVAVCYSAGVTAAKLMGANARQMRAATMIAAVGKEEPYMSPAKNFEGSRQTMNVLSYACVARSGVEAAELAMRGFDGPILEDNAAASTRYTTCGLSKE